MDKPARFLALDVFRGLAVCLMIVVNTAGPGAHAYPILVHAKWFGFTAADWVFPSFVFAVGSAMAFALQRPMTDTAFAVKVLRRTALIFAAGVFMYWFPFVHREGAGWAANPFGETRLTGVLQRIALCYLLAAFAVRYLKTTTRLLILCAVLLLGYWAILLAFGDPADPFAKLSNAGTRLDLRVYGQAHLYRRDGGFDPEGLLGTLPAVVNAIAGYLAARFLISAPERRRALARMAFAGLILALVALAWAPLFPIAKKLWTSSFVLLTVGSDLVILAGLAAVLEGRKPDPVSRFFQIFGRNPLVIYLFSELFVVALQLIHVAPDVGLYDWVGISVFQAAVPGALGSLACAIAYMLVCWLLAYALDRGDVTLRF